MTNYNKALVRNFQKSFKNLFEEDYLNNNPNNANKDIKYIKKWNKCRIDIKNYGNENNTLEILSSKNMSVNFPKWLANNQGKGCVIQSSHNNLNISIKCIQKGQLTITLRGTNYKSEKGSKIPIYINYKKMMINQDILFLEDKIISHDNPFKYTVDCEDNQLLNVKIEFETIYDYVPKLNDYIDKFKNKEFTLEDYNEFENYINKSVNEDANNNINTVNLVNQLNDKINYMYFENEKLKNELLETKKNYDIVLDSYNKQFSTIFLDYDLTPRGILKYTQELCIELLNFVVSLCEKYDLSYWLDFGTLLGAKRHNGFIPWDDDVDIAMTRKDFDRFIEIIDKEIKDNNLDDVVTVNIDKIFRGTIISFVQIKYSADSKYLFAGLDIFPYDFKAIKEDNITDIYFVEQQKFRKELKQGRKRKDLIEESYKNLGLSLDQQEYIIPGVDSVRGKYQRYSFDILESNKIFPLKEETYCGEKYCVPNNPDYYLKSIYKNYNKMPRIIEIHRRISDLKKNPDNEEIFLNEIQKMKKINEKYN